MDYEKAYKAMVQRVKELHKDGNALTKQQMEIVCPELAESEDERIRKWLIKEMHRFHDCAIKEMCQEDINKTEIALAWLEKQKDINCLACDEHLKGYLAGRKVTEEEQKELPFVKDVMLGYPGLYFYDGERMHFQGNPAMEENPYDFAISQQKEQKPGTTEDNPIDSFDTKLFQDGAKEGRRLEREDMQKEPFSCGQENGSSEEPVLPGIEDPGTPGKDFIPVEWVAACEKYGKWKIVKQEQPEADLEIPDSRMLENIALKAKDAAEYINILLEESK